MNSFNCDISANGRFIAFDSYSPNLSTSDGDSSDIFLHDVQAGKTYLASVGMNSTKADDSSTFPAVSDAGRFVAFESQATNLIANDGNHVQDVFRYDRTTKTTKRLSVATDGTAGNQTSYYPELSGDWTWAVSPRRGQPGAQRRQPPPGRVRARPALGLTGLERRLRS